MGGGPEHRCCGMRRARVCSTLDAARCTCRACLSIHLPALTCRQASMNCCAASEAFAGVAGRIEPLRTCARASPCADACVSVSACERVSRACLRAQVRAHLRRREHGPARRRCVLAARSSSGTHAIHERDVVREVSCVRRLRKQTHSQVPQRKHAQARARTRACLPGEHLNDCAAECPDVRRCVLPLATQHLCGAGLDGAARCRRHLVC